MKYQVLHLKLPLHNIIVCKNRRGNEFEFVTLVWNNKVVIKNLQHLYLNIEWSQGILVNDDTILFEANTIISVIDWLEENLWIHVM